MARSRKPLLWLPFAAGGTVAALILPGLVLLTLLASLGLLPADALSYERVNAVVGHWAGAAVTFAVVATMLWHAAHRLRMTLQDLGVRATATRRLTARTCYGLAAAATLMLAAALVAIQ